MKENELEYGGFWSRFAAMWIDALIWSPLAFFTIWAKAHSRYFEAYWVLPSLMLGFFYHVYLVRKFGGTPGKLLLRLKITKPDGSSVGYREAVLRALPDYVLITAAAVGFAAAALRMEDSEYFSLSYRERGPRLRALAPGWFEGVNWAHQIWVWSEFIVLLTNEKRRALHDFIAGTVVIKKPTQQPQQQRP